MKLVRPVSKTTLAVVLLLTALAAWGVQAATRAIRARTTLPLSMAAMVPQGALLSIESPDFTGLLSAWNSSPEQRAWLASANYSVFSNSRLFGRLNDARTQFETTASKGDNTLGIDGDFLTQIAGHQSIFAWYDVGKLEFLYITRLTPAQAAASALMKQRASFTTRQAAGTSFYLRRSTDPDSGTPRTVAFAQVAAEGNTFLLLATREDLMANALELIHTPTASQSLAQEPWYAEVTAAMPPATSAPPALHMMLNLERIVPLPAFRSYWVQQNVSAMKQYRAAAADLYRETNATGAVFREERVLLPAATLDAPADSAVPALAALVPTSTGVYHALATHDTSIALTALDEKLLGGGMPAQLPATAAPDPSLSAVSAGSGTDLETYIDTMARVSAGASDQPLAQAMSAAGLDAVLTTSTAEPPATPSGLWVPIHNAVVLHAASAWKPEALTLALQETLRGSLTAASLGIQFRLITSAGQSIYSLSGPRPLYFAVRGQLWLLADDQPLLLALLQQGVQPAAAASAVTQVAAFSHAGQRAAFQRLTSLIDGTNRAPDPAAKQGDAATPAFFSQNIGSLSNAFASLTSEHFLERRDGPNLRQTVTYQWQPH